MTDPRLESDPGPPVFQVVKNIILRQTEPNPLVAMLKTGVKDVLDDEVACCEILAIFRKIDDRVEQERTLLKMADMIAHLDVRLVAIDQLVTKIIYQLYEKEIFSISSIACALITTLDMRFRVPMDPQKVQFIREHLHEIDYKGIRQLLRSILVDKFDRIISPNYVKIISPYELHLLMPLEELALALMDRKMNVCPPLHTITEVLRLMPSSPLHLLPRLSKEIRGVVASFRCMADVTSIINRTFLYPITACITYSWLGNSWRLVGGTIQTNAHLPYHKESSAQQSYFQHMLLKQPRSHLNLGMINRYQPNDPIRMKYTDIFHILIMEAMTAVENTPHPVHSEINQYNWRHVFHVVLSALPNGHIGLSELIENLNNQMSKEVFRKARGELMWMLLQIFSSFIALVATKGWKKFPFSTVNEIFAKLYPDELSWTGSSGESWSMARFFAPVSLWMHMRSLGAMIGEDIQPPEKIARQIEFLDKHIASGSIPDDGMFVVIANSCDETSANNATFTHVLNKLSSANLPPYHLPFGTQADGALECLDIKVLEALTFKAKYTLHNQLLNQMQIMLNSGKFPSPATVETVTRIALQGEPHKYQPMSLRLLLMLKPKPNERSEMFCLLLYDIIIYRLKNLQLSPLNRCLLFTHAYDMMPIPQQSTVEKLPLYVLMEQTILRQFLIPPPYEQMPLVSILLKKPIRMADANIGSINIFSSPNAFFSANSEFKICPEVSKIILIYFVMSYKLTADYPGENLSDIFALLTENYKLPKCTLRWFPDNMSSYVKADTMPDTQLCVQYERSCEAEQQLLNDAQSTEIFQQNRPPVTFITMFRTLILFPGQLSQNAYRFDQFENNIFSAVNVMSIVQMTANINAFVEYIILKTKDVRSDGEFDRIVDVVYKMLFVDRLLPFERFLLALVVHPNDNESIKLSLIILSSLLKCEEKPEFASSKGLARRLLQLYAFLPPNSALLTHKSEDYFRKLFTYRKEFAEYDFESINPSGSYRHGIPMYYSTLAERIVPIIDILFLRCFESGIDKSVLEIFMKVFAPIYRYHPQPITYLYKLCYVLDGIPLSPGLSLAKFVIIVCRKLEEEKTTRFLTAEFVEHQHADPRFCEVLVDRIVAASVYVHHPPDFVAKDWRLAELPPAAQALTSACVELIASPKEVRDIVDALIAVCMRRQVDRTIDHLNAVALLLCNLPKRFRNAFFDRIEESFDWPALRENGPDYMFSSANVEMFQFTEDRIMTLLSLVHAFIQHAGADVLALFTAAIESRIAPKVYNETQMIYFLRILTPYLMKVSDREKTHHGISDSSTQYVNLIFTIYEMVPRIMKTKPHLEYEDLICDILYLFKYTVKGYSVNKETEDAIARFPQSMQEKLKFLPSPGVDVTDKIKKTIPHATLQMLFEPTFSNITHPTDIDVYGAAHHQQMMQHSQQMAQQNFANQQQPNMPILQPNAAANMHPNAGMMRNEQMPQNPQMMNPNMPPQMPPGAGQNYPTNFGQPYMPPQQFGQFNPNAPQMPHGMQQHPNLHLQMPPQQMGAQFSHQMTPQPMFPPQQQHMGQQVPPPYYPTTTSMGQMNPHIATTGQPAPMYNSQQWAQQPMPGGPQYPGGQMYGGQNQPMGSNQMVRPPYGMNQMPPRMG